MNEIENLLEQYKGVVNTLELINKKYLEIQEIEKIREELKTSKKEIINLNSYIERLKKNNNLFMTILREVNHLELCKECQGDGGFDDGYSGGCSCDTCEGRGFKTRAPEPILISNLEEKKRFFNLLSKDEIIEMYFGIYNEYIKYFNLNLQNMQKECILMKDIINSISIWEFIKQKY